jgi:hypothetical protein
MSERIENLAVTMFETLAECPEPMQRDTIMAIMGMTSVVEFHDVKGALQDALGGADTITVIGEPTADEGGWYYSLEADGASEKSRVYLAYKERQIFARQSRAWMVVNALCRASDARTVKGRALRRQRRSITRSLEDTLDVMTELGIADLPAMPG